MLEILEKWNISSGNGNYAFTVGVRHTSFLLKIHFPQNLLSRFVNTVQIEITNFVFKF